MMVMMVEVVVVLVMVMMMVEVVLPCYKSMLGYHSCSPPTVPPQYPAGLPGLKCCRSTWAARSLSHCPRCRSGRCGCQSGGELSQPPDQGRQAEEVEEVKEGREEEEVVAPLPSH